MKTEDQVIAIAAACGWFRMSTNPSMFEYRGPNDDFRLFEGEMIPFNRIPIYHKDLNAMHYVETILSDEQWKEYLNWLSDIVSEFLEIPNSPARLCSYAHASAAQRAEAFLKTIKQWEYVE